MEYGKLRIFYSTAIDSFDPMQSDRFDLMFYHKNIYAALVSNFRLGKIEPMIAESWQVSEDGREWRFKIRKNIKFTNGDSIGAKDVYGSLKRIFWLTKNDKTRIVSLFSDIDKWDKYGEDIKFLKLEKDEVVFKFSSRPKNLFETLSQPLYSIVHPSCYDENGNWKKKDCYIGSGQYEATNISEKKVILKNRHVYNEVVGSPEEVEIITHISLDKTNPYDYLLEERADFTVFASANLNKNDKRKLRTGRFYITERPKVNMMFLELNHRKDIFLSKKVRKTIRDRFICLLSEDEEYDINTSFIPQGGIGYVEFKKYPYEVKLKHNTNDRKVKILALKNRGGKLNLKIYKILEQIFSEHGIKWEYLFLDSQKILEERNSGNYDALLLMSGILITDPWADLRLMFMSDVGARIPDPSGKIPSLIEKAENTDNPDERRKIAEKINKLIYDEAAVITYLHTSMDYVHKDFIDLSEVNLFSDPIEFRCISINK